MLCCLFCFVLFFVLGCCFGLLFWFIVVDGVMVMCLFIFGITRVVGFGCLV